MSSFPIPPLPLLPCLAGVHPPVFHRPPMPQPRTTVQQMAAARAAQQAQQARMSSVNRRKPEIFGVFASLPVAVFAFGLSLASVFSVRTYLSPPSFSCCCCVDGAGAVQTKSRRAVTVVLSWTEPNTISTLCVFPRGAGFDVLSSLLFVLFRSPLNPKLFQAFAPSC